MSVPTFPGKQASVRWWLEAATVATQSPFTLTEQVQDWGGRQWQFEIPVGITQGADGRRLSAFFNALGGAAGRFILPIVSQRSTVYFGSPVMWFLAEAGASTILSEGWTPGADVQPGDLFSVGTGASRRLHEVSQEAIAGPLGRITLQFHPPLRAQLPVGAALDFATPSCACRLTGPVPADIAPADIYRFTLRAREAL